MSYIISFVVFLILLLSPSLPNNDTQQGGNNSTTSTASASTTRTVANPIGIIRIRPTPVRPPTTTKPVAPKKQSTEFTPPDHTVSVAGIFYYTNLERTKNKVPALKKNSILQTLAEARAKDMIDKNYFDHTSPTGQNVSDLAAKYHYIYRFLGENLAMGDFSTSEELVNDWMQSPGHRENILNPEYTQLGVAAVYANIMDRKQWIAVQVFGKPF